MTGSVAYIEGQWRQEGVTPRAVRAPLPGVRLMRAGSTPAPVLARCARQATTAHWLLGAPPRWRATAATTPDLVKSKLALNLSFQ